MEKIEINIKNDRKVTDRISQVIIIIHLIIFLGSYLMHKVSIIPFVETLFAGCFYYSSLLIKNRNYPSKNNAFILLMIAWLSIGIYSMAFLCIVLYFVVKGAEADRKYNFLEDEIQSVSIMKIRYSWNGFANIILKDNILTLDFTDNKIIQREITNCNVSEEYFNNFVQLHLSKNPSSL